MNVLWRSWMENVWGKSYCRSAVRTRPVRLKKLKKSKSTPKGWCKVVFFVVKCATCIRQWRKYLSKTPNHLKYHCTLFSYHRCQAYLVACSIEIKKYKSYWFFWNPTTTCCGAWNCNLIFFPKGFTFETLNIVIHVH